jgi:hypothetical protein
MEEKMATRKRTLVDWGWSLIKELLKDKAPTDVNQDAAVKKARLEDLSIDDLQREKIRLAQEERKLIARLKEVEKQKKQLFAEGVQNDSDRERRVIARRIKELDVEANNMDRMLQIISKQMRTLNGLMQLKERARMASESGLTNLITNLDLEELIRYIDKASVDGEFNMDKFNQVLEALEEAEAVSPEYREDQDVLDLVAAMEETRTRLDHPDALEKGYNEVEQRLSKRSAELYENDELEKDL